MTKPQYKTKFYALFASQQDRFGLSYRNKTGTLVQTLPWQTPHKEDMHVFRHLTKHNIVVMGSKTFESFGKNGLPDRTNIVVSSKASLGIESMDMKLPGQPPKPSPQNPVYFVSTLEQAINMARCMGASGMDCFFIGGKTLLESLFADHLDLLDGVYYAGIASSYPAKIFPPDATEVSTILFQTPEDIYKNPSVMQLATTLHGKDVTYLKYVKTTNPGELKKFVQLDLLTDNLNEQPYKDHFYTPSPSQAKLNKLAENPTEADEKTIELISSQLNPKVVELAVDPTFKRDRGMSGIDPFDVTSAWRESVNEIEKYLSSNTGDTSKFSPQKPSDGRKTNIAEVLSGFVDGAPTLEDNSSSFVAVATEIGELLVVKDAAYGSAFEKTKEILKILFPNGLPVEAFDDGLTIQRILDKICRLTVLCTNPEENKTEERTEDAWKDIAGYAIKALCEQRRKKANKQ